MGWLPMLIARIEMNAIRVKARGMQRLVLRVILFLLLPSPCGRGGGGEGYKSVPL